MSFCFISTGDIKVANIADLEKSLKASKALRQSLEPLRQMQEKTIETFCSLMNEPFIIIQRFMANNFEHDPKFILLVALMEPEDKEELTHAVDKLIRKMDNGNALLAGEPPQLIILGEKLTYEDILSIEDVAPRYSDELRKINLQDAWGILVRIMRDAKISAKYKRGQEIKKQSSRRRYRELSLDKIILDSPNLEPSKDGLQDQVTSNITIEQYLKRMKGQARQLGWREDRAENCIKVAKYAMANGTLRASNTDLNMDRHTVGARKNDLRLLLSEIREE